MTKRMTLLALSFAATVLLATNGFGQACSSGFTPRFVGVGSSAQYNTGTYAAIDAINGEIAAGNPTFTAPALVWTTKNATLQDSRVAPAALDNGVKGSIVWDSSPVCNVYVILNADSTIGNRCFFATAKSVAPATGTYGACTPATNSKNWNTAAGVNLVPGLTDSALPAALSAWIVASPAPTAAGQAPQPQCSQQGAVGATTFYCFFNAALTDVRPEDSLYATTRALTAYNTTNGVSGLGYDQTACGASTTHPTLDGCVITDSFNKGGAFNVLSFKLTGTDPFTTAAVPVYTTLTTGVSPVVILAQNQDTSTYGLGATQSDGSYLFKDINRKVLGFIFDGTTSCTADILPVTPTPAAYGGAIPTSPGVGIQAIIREPLSGTYNTFEFTGVRQLTGSALAAINISKISATAWLSDDDSSQELDPEGNLALGPATNYGASTCSPFPTGATACGDPLYNPSKTSACSGGYRARAIGTGEEVAASIGLDNVSGGLSVEDGMGYTFWSYQNIAPVVTGVSGFACETGVSGDVTCSTGYLAHYLTVDAIDPLFSTEGGALSPTLGSSPENPTGPYNLPQCGAIVNGAAVNPFPCLQIPFTHIYDGKYPLWSQLRIVTLAPVTGKQVIPSSVINLIGYAQAEAAPGSTKQFSDFVPFLNSVSGLPYQQGLGNVTNAGSAVTWAGGDQFSYTWCGAATFPATCTGAQAAINIKGVAYSIKTINSKTSLTLATAPASNTKPVDYVWNAGALPTGNLNIGVFRSHRKQSGINPANGHWPCGTAPNFNFTGVLITGGTAANPTCLVDFGGDVGGSVFTVRSDVDFYTDFGVLGSPHPKEIYGLQQ
jgi:hypothetical protein